LASALHILRQILLEVVTRVVPGYPTFWPLSCAWHDEPLQVNCKSNVNRSLYHLLMLQPDLLRTLTPVSSRQDNAKRFDSFQKVSKASYSRCTCKIKVGSSIAASPKAALKPIEVSCSAVQIYLCLHLGVSFVPRAIY
jgi:hypothetical protein